MEAGAPRLISAPVRRWVAAGALALLAWCAWVSGFHRMTTGARATWGISLTAVVVLDVLLWRGGRGRRLGLPVGSPAPPWPGPGRAAAPAWAGASPWVVLAGVVAAWDVLALDTGAHDAHLTISALTQAFRPLNAAMLLVWMAVGLGYGLTRARVAGPARHRRQRRPGGHDEQGGSATARCGMWLGTVALPLGASPVARWPMTRGPALLLPDSRGAGVAFWLAVVVAVVVLDQLARRSGGRMPDSEQFLRLVTDPMAARVLLVGAWGYAGYHLFAH